MKNKVFTLVFAFLAMAGNAIWGQETETLGGFTVTKDAATYDTEAKTMTITNNAAVNTSSETDDVIVIDGGETDAPIEVTLNGINISSEEAIPITITSNSFVKFILADGSANNIRNKKDDKKRWKP